MISRRFFLTLAASGLLVPEWLLEPPKGRSMVSVPQMPLLPLLSDDPPQMKMGPDAYLYYWDAAVRGYKPLWAWRPEMQP